jgi:hypothetical protein
MEGFMATIGRFTIELLAVDESHCVSTVCRLLSAIHSLKF